MGIKATQLASSLGLKGEIPATRAGASAINDIHYDPKTKGHINHSELGDKAATLAGSKFNQSTPYANPEK
jgi:hypothetical protein